MSRLTHDQTRSRTGAVTIQQVAVRAGVAAMTVSRALKDPSKVSPSLRASVAQAVQELGYIRNHFAGALASATSPIVPLLVPALDNVAFIDVIDGVQAEFQRSGLELLLGVTGYDLKREAELISTLLGWSPSGFIVVGGRHLPRARAMLQAFKGPVVEVAELSVPSIDMTVGMSHVRAGAAMAAHLIERGRREIGFVGGRLDADYRARQRFVGLDRRLAAAGLRRRPPFTHPEPSSVTLGGDKLMEVLQAAPELDAIFFSNDDLAVGAILRAAYEGIAIPERIAIAGFNGLDIARHTRPSLTTIVTPRRSSGTLAAQKLIARINGEAAGPRRVDLGFDLSVGDST